MCDLDARELRREVKTCSSHCDAPCYLYQSTFLDRHLHIILKFKKLKIYMMDRAITGKTFFLLLDLRYPDRKPDGFPIPNSSGLFGNIYWGESLIVVTCDFLGLNNFIWHFVEMYIHLVFLWLWSIVEHRSTLFICGHDSFRFDMAPFLHIEQPW